MACQRCGSQTRLGGCGEVLELAEKRSFASTQYVLFEGAQDHTKYGCLLFEVNSYKASPCARPENSGIRSRYEEETEVLDLIRFVNQTLHGPHARPVAGPLPRLLWARGHTCATRCRTLPRPLQLGKGNR